MTTIAPPRTNGLAVASFVLGLCGLAILPVILGHIALGQIRRTGEGGSAFAIIGLVLGYLAIVLYLVLIAMIVIPLVIVGLSGGFA